MKYFSMFSGIGGFELGIQSATGGTWECIGYSELNKYAIQVYEKHFKGHKNHGDATRIVPEQLPGFDFLCGGFPCQAFSIAGKRGGFKDTRGTLFFEIARILSVKRPKLLLLENVKGLLSHDNGRTFGTILATLSELGYFCEWQVLNSKDFGVPQNRERVFIVGHLGESGGREVFPITEGGCGDIKGKQDDSGTSRTISARFAKGVGNTESRIIDVLIDAVQSQRIHSIEQLSVTLSGNGGGQGAKTGLYAIPVLTPNRAEKRQNGRRMKEDGEDSFTVTAQDQHGVYDGHRIRRLTPTECERLQSFPDNWTKFGIDYLTPEAYNRDYANAKETNPIEVLSLLQKAVDSPSGEGRRFTEFASLLKDEILQSYLHEESIRGEIQREPFAPPRQMESKAISYCNRMWELWLEEESRHPPQRRKHIKQLFVQLSCALQKLSYPTSSIKPYQIILLSDSSRYKCLGNAVTTNVIEAIISKMVKESE